MAVLRLVPATGQPLEVTRDEATVGRDQSCDVVVADGSVSRRHAKLLRRGDDWVVADQGSANGTFVDGQRAAETVLRDGQQLRFGSIAFTVEIERAAFSTDATVVGSSEATVLQSAPPPPAPVRPPVAAPPPPPRPSAPPVAAPPPPPAARPPAPAPPAAPPPPPVRGAGPPPPPARPGMPPARPAAPPAGAGAPAPAKGGKSTWMWIGGGCCGCLLLILLAIGVAVGFGVLSAKGAVDEIQAQLADLRAGQMEQAYARFTPDYQARVPFEDFQRLVSDHPSLSENKEGKFGPFQGSVAVNNDKATIEGVLVGPEDVRDKATYELVKADGKWRISDLTLEGSGNASAPPTTSPPPTDAPPPPAGAEMRVETLSVGKEEVPGGVKVTIDVRVSGFSVRQEGGSYSMEVAEDLETIDPAGNRVDSLSREDIQTLRETLPSPQDNTATFQTVLTVLEPPPGSYTARLTLRDQVGGGRAVHEIPFDLP